MTTLHRNEKKQVPKLLRAIKDHCEYILADKNYDDNFTYKAIEKFRPTRYIKLVKRDAYSVVIPPHRNAKIRTRKVRYPLERSKHIEKRCVRCSFITP